MFHAEKCPFEQSVTEQTHGKNVLSCCRQAMELTHCNKQQRPGAREPSFMAGDCVAQLGFSSSFTMKVTITV